MVSLTARNDALCPCTALSNHLEINSNVLPTSSLFTYHTSSGDFKNMFKHNFLTFVTSVWKSAYLAHVLGHSFRISGAIELLLAGVAPEIVMATGGGHPSLSSYIGVGWRRFYPWALQRLTRWAISPNLHLFLKNFVSLIIFLWMPFPTWTIDTL